MKKSTLTKLFGVIAALVVITVASINVFGSDSDTAATSPDATIAWEYVTDELTSPDKALRATAQTYYVEGEKEVWLNIDVRNAGNGGYSESIRFEKGDMHEARPVLIGWSADSNKVYFTTEVINDETCDTGVGYFGLYVLYFGKDLNTATLETIHEPYEDDSFFVDYSLSPDRSELVLMFDNEGDRAIELIDVKNAKIMSNEPMAKVNGGALSLTWTELNGKTQLTIDVGDIEPSTSDCTQ